MEGPEVINLPGGKSQAWGSTEAGEAGGGWVEIASYTQKISLPLGTKSGTTIVKADVKVLSITKND
jgi:hypothetical protein